MGAIGRFTLLEPVDGDVQGAFTAATAAAEELGASPEVLATKAWFGFPFREDADPSRLPDLQLVGLSAFGTGRDALASAWPAR